MHAAVVLLWTQQCCIHRSTAVRLPCALNDWRQLDLAARVDLDEGCWTLLCCVQVCSVYLLTTLLLCAQVQFDCTKFWVQA